MPKTIHGPIAALLTPRASAGWLDLDGLQRNLEHLIRVKATGVVPLGGTGEYPDLTFEQRRVFLERTLTVSNGRLQVIAGIGSMRLKDSVDLAEHALARGADALLLPPPHFYRYGQRDLEDFYRAAAKEINGPILIYNLAAFTSALESQLIVRLIESTPNLIGVKDSSGRLDALETLTKRDDLDAVRILGNDTVLIEALERGLIDAVISGPTGVVPELTVALFEAKADDDEERFRRAADLFDEMIEQFEKLPYPWALKLTAQFRRWFPAQLAFEPGAERQRQIAEFEQWFQRRQAELAAIR